MENIFRISQPLNLKGENAGLFISQGHGIHPTRVMDHHELIFVRKGTVELFEGDKHFILNEGDTLLFFSGRQHGGLADYSHGLSFFWVHFRMNNFPIGSEKEILEIPQTGHIRNILKMSELFRRYLDDQKKGELSQLQANLLLMMMLSEITLPRNQSSDSAGEALVEEVEKYIMMNAQNDISTSTIARFLKCSPDYLGRVFKAKTGHTVTDTINARRIYMVRRKLLESNMRISELAEECGFNDMAYFRRVFRKHTDTTPGAYRKLYSKVHINIE